MNKCHFVGKICRPVSYKLIERKEGRTVPVINFTLEVCRKFEKKTGESKEHKSYLDFEAWDSGAEKIYEGFGEGDWITVHTSAKVDTYVDNEGNKVSKVRFRVNEFEYPQWQNEKIKNEIK